MELTVSPATDDLSGLDEDALHIQTHTELGGSLPIVAAQGDIDLSTAPILRTALLEAFRHASPSGSIALDLREVGFIDSAGLALLVEIRKTYYDKTKLALLVQKSSQPERVLRLGRFDTFLKVGYQPEDIVVASTPPAGAVA